MSAMKEIDLLVNEIADVLGVHPDSISISQRPGGLWMADVSNIESESCNSAFDALSNLLEKARKYESTN
jgi:hypothetical protein